MIPPLLSTAVSLTYIAAIGYISFIRAARLGGYYSIFHIHNDNLLHCLAFLIWGMYSTKIYRWPENHWPNIWWNPSFRRQSGKLSCWSNTTRAPSSAISERGSDGAPTSGYWRRTKPDLFQCSSVTL